MNAQMVSSAADARTSAATVTLATLGTAGASWVLAVRQMNEMGRMAGLGSLGFFASLWVSMMGAMMLPGAIPAVSNYASASGRFRAVPLFIGSYLAVWALVGIAIYALYRAHGSVATGIVVMTAGVYEITPLKRAFRWRCRDSVGSGFQYGLCCVGSSIGLMLILVALGLMSVAWMSLIAVVVLVQKLLPSKTVVDVPLTLAIVGLGILIVLAPASVPAITSPM